MQDSGCWAPCACATTKGLTGLCWWMTYKVRFTRPTACWGWSWSHVGRATRSPGITPYWNAIVTFAVLLSAFPSFALNVKLSPPFALAEAVYVNAPELESVSVPFLGMATTW